ncbi:hypothetical protein MLD38_000436 [Melastoma candidum]|uniref:Uncharacterized protein n=1 Tax=Melastoma candidum TaxID=119954 RepID=A0ACB9SF04_9MYRT|nr:hypothetical protein MLD38_000436 [Melastoma candidum]
MKFFHLHVQFSVSVNDFNGETERDVFKALLRVNAYNRLEAYCTIDGVPVDILINGSSAQNRAVDGDIVAVKVDPVSFWTRMKGSLVISTCYVPSKDVNSSLEKNENSGSSGNISKQRLETNAKADYTGNAIHSAESDRFSSEIPCHLGLASNIPSVPDNVENGGSFELNDVEEALQKIFCLDGFRKYLDKSKKSLDISAEEFIQFTPIDNKFPKMTVLASDLPDEIRNRLCHFDETVETELLGHNLMQSCSKMLSVHPSSLLRPFSCLPQIPWDIPQVVLQHRGDLRNLCIFTIDPSTATDLDDALSVEVLADDIYRVGVHIADVSYFVKPNTPLDKEAQLRSASVYMVHKKVPMLPPLLSEDLGSLNPGVDRLAFSIFWDINAEGNIIDRHLGCTVIHSCCKLSYEQADDILRGVIGSECNDDGEESVPQVCGNFKLSDVISSVVHLHKISRILNENRLKGGALRLESPKVGFLLDEHGLPSDCFLLTRMDSNLLIEEFMILANKTAAEVISRAFPDAALLLRHPEPNTRKLRDLGHFCSRHGLELDTSSSGAFHKSLELAREKLKDDPVLFDILVLNATKSMQQASYFCTADYKDQEDKWAHYALAVPLITHFTSPLRRYPDILVHRMLAAALEAESYSRCRTGVFGRCFSGIMFDKKATEESIDLREALSTAAMQHGVPSKEVLVELAAHCNERKLASRDVKDATTKLYMWAFLGNKKNFLAEARVLALGPRFLSIYIPKLAIERRIQYDDVERLIVEWLEFTSTVVISLSPYKSRRSYLSKCPRALKDVALIIPTADDFGSVGGQKGDDPSPDSEIDPCVFPLTIRILSTIPVRTLCSGRR